MNSNVCFTCFDNINRKWKLQDALEYTNDRSLRSRDKCARIFIEPPDEDSLSCEDSDEDTPSTKLNVNCELILRNGKRLKTNCKQISPTELLHDVADASEKCQKSSQCDKFLTTNNRESKCSVKIPKQSRKRKLSKQSNTEELTKKICDENLVRDTEPVKGKSNSSKSKVSNKKVATDYIWIDDVSNPMEPIFPMPNYTDCTDFSAYEQFEKFFDDELLQMIIKESSNYAAYLGKPDPKITVAELRVYIAISVISGYSVQSRFESYWSRDPDLRNELIYQSMRKNRFKEIKQFLHFEDMNKPNTNDKIWKLRPLTDYLKKKFLQHFHAEQSLSYDESMIEYYGRHSMKQYLKDKPIPFGFKVWVLCTISGYTVNFEIYQGANPRSKTLYEELYGKCIAPLFNMIDDFDDQVRELPFSFYFDNLFTGIPALLQLKSLGYNATGTLRENRLPKSCPLKQKKKETAKLGRGFMTSKSVKGSDIHVTKWVDNAVVSVASTVYGMNPVTKALRYSTVEQKKVEVPRPLVVAKYNQSMGGVDRMDENISLYRIGIHGKKWWSCIFTWMIDVAIQNAWQLHRVAHPEMPQLDFRREITLYYCRHYGVPPKSTGNRKRKVAEQDPTNVRFDKLSHWPRNIAKRRRCAEVTCQSSPSTICGKCDVGLCIKCFESYHTIEKFKQ